MKIPFDGNVKPRLLEKLYKDKIFYNVTSNGYKSGKYSIKPCKLSTDDYGNVVWQIIDGYKKYAKWEDIFDIYEVTKEECKRRNQLYKEGFYEIPYVTLDTLEKYKDQMLHIEETINKYLAGFENFEGIDFCDVYAGGIQIRGHCKQIKGYTYGGQPTIKYDFSNAEDVIWEFIKMWGEIDNTESIRSQLAFIRDGEKYGWD